MTSTPQAKRFYSYENPKKSVVVTVVTGLMVIYCLAPLLWLVINSTKTLSDFISTFGLAFGSEFALLDNINQVFTYDNGIFFRWLLNTLLYVVVGSVVSTFIAALGGYALARIQMRGKKAFLFLVLGAVAVPGIALAIPQFLLFAQLGLTNTPLSVLIPSFVNPFGLYLMWIFASQAIPMGLIEAGRIDGAGEFTIFGRICLPLLKPAIVTVLLFSFVGIWNNYFLPLIMLQDAKWFPLTIGLAQWNEMGNSAGTGAMLQNLVITGSLITILPTIILFLSLQRYWRDGLALGAVKG